MALRDRDRIPWSSASSSDHRGYPGGRFFLSEGDPRVLERRKVFYSDVRRRRIPVSFGISRKEREQGRYIGMQDDTLAKSHNAKGETPEEKRQFMASGSEDPERMAARKGFFV